MAAHQTIPKPVFALRLVAMSLLLFATILQLLAISLQSSCSAWAESPEGPELHSHSPSSDPYASGDGFLHFPGVPPIPIRPKNEAFDPRQSPAGTYGQDQGKPHRTAEPASPPKPLTPTEKAEAIRKALAPRPPVAELRKHTLDEIFGKLAAARDEDEAKGLAAVAGRILMHSDSDTANLLMQRVSASIEAHNFPLSLKLLDRLTELQPDWTEVWARRAELRYLKGDFDGAMADASHALKLEPRHFATIEIMAAVLQQTGFEKRALEAYRRALAVYPHQPSIEKVVEKLRLDVEGQGI